VPRCPQLLIELLLLGLTQMPVPRWDLGPQVNFIACQMNPVVSGSISYVKCPVA
jgi:hypothetical protein